jgi:hypothetical protein
MNSGGRIIALLTGPLQLWLGLANRSMAWHRCRGSGAEDSFSARDVAESRDFAFITAALEIYRPSARDARG